MCISHQSFMLCVTYVLCLRVFVHVYTVEFFIPLQLEPTVTKWFQESSRIGNVSVLAQNFLLRVGLIRAGYSHEYLPRLHNVYEPHAPLMEVLH